MSGCLKEANVYGVQVPGSSLNRVIEMNLFCNQQSQLSPCLLGNSGHEGRIGMAAVTVREGEQFDGKRMYNHMVSYLPSYARPRFIRIRVIPFHTHRSVLNAECVITDISKTRLLFLHAECLGGDGNLQADEAEAGGGGF